MNKHAWLVLSGSGMRLYAFLGGIKALVEDGYTFEGVTGTSGGAVVAALLGKHWDPTDPMRSVDAMIEQAKSIDVTAELKKSFRWRVWEWVLTKLFRAGPRGMFNTTNLLKRFRQELPATIGDCALPVHITGYQVNLNQPRAILFTKPDSDLPLAVLGSMSLPPPLFDPTVYGTAMLQDGGWTANFAIPDDQSRVVGLYFGMKDDGPGVHEGIVTNGTTVIDDNIELWMKTIFGVIDNNTRVSIEEAEEEGVDLKKIALKTEISSFDFFASKEEREKAIDDGYESAKKALL